VAGGGAGPEGAGVDDLEALRVLFEHSPVPQFVADGQGALLLANPAYAALVGGTVDEVLGSIPADVTHPDDLPELLRQGQRLLTGKVPLISLELRVMTSDGSYRWCLATCSSAPTARGQQVVVCQLLDVDDRRRAEEELATSQARFRGMADSVPVGIHQRDATGRLVYVNEQWTEITGLTEAEALGAHHVEVIHPDDRDRVLAATFRLAEEGGPYHEQFRVVRPDGTVRWVSSRSARVSGPDGTTDAFVGSIEDITALLEAQEEVNRLAAIAETTGDLVGVVDADGWVVWANEAARVVHGIDPERQPVHSTSLYTAESLAWFYDHILPAMVRGERWMGELDMYGADGEVISIWQSLAPQLDPDGELVSIAAVGRDLTDRKRREADLAHRATHDVLTGLPNRALLLDRLEHAVDVVRSSSTDEVSLLFIDLDRFKIVNDELGHDAGDALLRVVADRLAGALRGVDVVARLGGDEFVVLCPGLGRIEAEDVARRLLRAVSESPIAIGDRRLEVTASVGVTVAAPSEDHHAEGLLREADVAMYLAKAHGRNRFEVYDG
jgi:diguanylate cyclase (GGDEF)-like protein/PAS domain S-box-containing protein